MLFACFVKEWAEENSDKEIATKYLKERKSRGKFSIYKVACNAFAGVSHSMFFLE